MDEYIKREDLLELYRIDDPVLNENGHVPLPVIRQNIMDIPAADVAPVRHGYWVIDDYNTRECHCSECDWPAPRDVYEYHREQTGYCPVCGAKMELEER